jgi:16S rRNA (guanine966-N2)-methyltransferase
MNKSIQHPRIVAGKYKSLKLEVSNISRPITERAKIVLFDTLNNLIANSSVLDLFAGTGNLGIEALSRGAKLAIFVEGNKEAFEVLKSNLKKLNLEKFQHKIFFEDYLKFISSHTGSFDIIFIDPPFNIQKKVRIDKILELLSIDGIMVYKVDGSIVDEIKVPENAEIVLSKKIGINTLLFIKRK